MRRYGCGGPQGRWSDKGRYKPVRYCIQGTWFLVNKSPRMTTTNRHGVGRDVIFVERKKQLGVFFRKGKD